MDLDGYRTRAEALARRLNAAQYARHSAPGGGPRYSVAALVAEDPGLVAPEAVDALLAGGHRRLARFAVECRLEARVAGAPPDVAVERVRHEARVLGWPSARAMVAQLAGVVLDDVEARARRVLRAAAIDPPEHAAPPAARWRDLLPRDLPFTIEEVPGLPRAFCAALDVPGDVRVVVGTDAPASVVLHEAGHAVLLATRPADAPFEDRFLVDRAEAEATAYAAEALAGPLDPGREPRMAAALLNDLAVLDHGPVADLAERVQRADPLLHSLDYFSAFSTAPSTDLRLALRFS